MVPLYKYHNSGQTSADTICVVSGHTRRLRGSIMTSFSDLFKLGKEVLKTEMFVLHEAETRGVDEGVRAFLFVFSSVFVLCF